MSENEDLSYQVEVKLNNADRQLNKLTDSFAAVVASGTAADSTMDRLEKQTVKVSAAVSAATLALRAQSKELKGISQYTTAMQAYATATESAAKAAARFKSNTNLKGFSVFGKAQQASVAAQVPASSQMVSTRAAAYQPSAFTQELHRQRDATYEQVKANSASAASAEKVQAGFEGIANTRYALYSVARSMAVVSAATLGLSFAAVKTAAEYESLFASVQRVAQTDPQTFAQLKTDLIDLSTEIPATIEDITAIATLGGQLGIAAGDLDNFTEVVVKFSATTGIAADTAAESLGRVAQLSGVASSEYSNLASSIYQAGITSVSTEAQILSMTEQIAVSGRQAGFSADQTVALASALASLGVQPERARGSIQQLFAIITNAVDHGGAKLDAFGKISGQTASAFAQQWKTDAQGAFLSFIQGLGGATEKGANLNDLLGQVGITGLRVTDVIKRLSQNTGVYTSAIQQSSSAFQANTALTDGYAVVADTLNAKLQVLGNTIKAMIEAANNNAVLKVLVDLLQKVFNVLLAVSRTETGKVIGGVVLAFTALLGVLALVGAGVAAVAASVLAAITALRFMTKEAGANTSVFLLARVAVIKYAESVRYLTPVQAEAALASRGLSSALTGVAASSRVAAVTIKGFKYALVSTGIGIALVALGEAASFLWGKLAGGDAPSRFTDDLEGLSKALSGDTQAALAGTDDAVTSFTVAIDKNGNVLSEADAEAANFAAAMNNVGDVTGTANDVVKAQTVYVGKLTKEWLANSLVTGDTGEKFVKDLQSLAPYLEQAGTSVSEVFNNAIKGTPVDLSPLRKQFSDEFNRLRTQQSDLYDKLYTNPLADPNQTKIAMAAYDALPAKIKAAKDQLAAFDSVTPALDSVNEKLLGTVQYGNGVQLVFQALGIQADDTSDGLDDATNALDGFLSTSLSASQGVSDLRDNLYSLGQTIAQNGVTLDLNTQAGRNNYNAIQQTVELLSKQSGGNSDIFAASLQNLLNMLKGLGYTNQQLAVFHTLLGGATATTQAIGLAGITAGSALKDGFDKGTKSLTKTNKAANSVAKTIRTLSDYVSDLTSTMKTAFDFRFGLKQASDDTLSSTYAISKGFQDAKDKVRDLKLEIMALNASLLTLKSDQSILEYQLKVAIEYGDTLRAQDITAKLAENASDQAKATSDLTDKQKEQADAQAAATATASGNSDAAIEQRKNLLDLVQSVEDQIAAYAGAGHSAKQVAAYAKVLRDRLADQLKQWGYNKDEVKRYTASINDFIQIINRVPRNLTVTVTPNTDPAKVALDAFFAKYNNKHVSVDVGVNGPSPKDVKAAVTRIGDIVDVLNLQWKAQGAAKSGDYELAASYGKQIQQKIDRIKANKYASGGYTGPGGKYDEAGTVHKGEFVFDQAATNYYGPAKLQAMMEAARSGRSYAPSTSSGGGGGGGAVELSAYDRKLLIAARVVQATIVMPNGRVLAQVVAEEQQNSGRRGN